MSEKRRHVPATVKNPGVLAQRRAELVDVATQLFLRNGFHKTSIREIARACSFNVASLYMYVTSKEDILFLVAQRLVDEKAAALGDIFAEGDDPVAAYLLAFQRYCRIIDKYRQGVKLLYREMDVLPSDRQTTILESEIAVHELFREIIDHGIQDGSFRPVNSGLAAQNTVFLAHMWSLKHWSLKRETTFEEFLEAQSAFLMSTLLPKDVVTGPNTRLKQNASTNRA